jgi:hypothetical protein
MKKLNLISTAVAGLVIISSFSSSTMIDLHKLVKNNGVNVFNRELTLINEKDHKGIRLSKDEGEGVAWIKGVEFSNGTLEFDVRGEDVKQHSFVGIAFHGVDDATFDAIYFRPFHFNATDEISRARAVQYISLPDFPWRTLRERFQTKYEHAAEPTPDPNAWFNVRVVVKDAAVSVYINGSANPSMAIEKVAAINKGMVGFYVADTSGGDFANLVITKMN